jgi:NAD(P)-dependent dehydrogenase (short-subunit alcohol dehydrogenase family)
VDSLVKIGHTIVGCGRSQAQIAELRYEHGPRHRFDEVDVAAWTEVKVWAKDVVSRISPPDLLINNAGIINRNAPLWEVPAEEFGRVLDVNVDGTANVIRAFLPAMIDRGRGVIVNMSSGWGRSTAPEVAPYCASKWAIEGLTQALAKELPPGLAAVAVSPGVVDTEMLRSCWADSAASCPSPGVWAKGATKLLLSLGVEHNGHSLST